MVLSFENFKKLAKNENLKPYEKVGFADVYRKSSEIHIFPDIQEKLSLSSKLGTILDIGCGCSGPVLDLIKFCENNQRNLILMDSQEMLDNLPNGDYQKISCEFPNCEDFINTNKNTIESIVIYSVFHHVFHYANIFNFLDNAVSLLKPHGQLLLADIPNNTKKKRFLSSDDGISFHQNWAKSDTIPEVHWNKLTVSQIDDSIIFSILQRYRSMGYETYLLPQKDGLPMNKTREDILIVRN